GEAGATGGAKQSEAGAGDSWAGTGGNGRPVGQARSGRRADGQARLARWAATAGEGRDVGRCDRQQWQQWQQRPTTARYTSLAHTDREASTAGSQRRGAASSEQQRASSSRRGPAEGRGSCGGQRVGLMAAGFPALGRWCNLNLDGEAGTAATGAACGRAGRELRA
ncbi:hypothetical protein P154DRAFT_577829, partial [Amniculicola lignicola CBS 123094]